MRPDGPAGSPGPGPHPPRRQTSRASPLFLHTALQASRAAFLRGRDIPGARPRPALYPASRKVRPVRAAPGALRWGTQRACCARLFLPDVYVPCRCVSFPNPKVSVDSILLRKKPKPRNKTYLFTCSFFHPGAASPDAATLACTAHSPA